MSDKPERPRKLLHTRSVTCRGFEREDGLWDIEGHMHDVKAVDMLHSDGSLRLAAGRPLHDMALRITIDDEMRIVDAEAITNHAPQRACPEAAYAYGRLKGLTIGAGFTTLVKARFKGVQGCTHLTELLGPMATTAYQTLFAVLEQRWCQKAATAQPGDQQGPRPPLVDSCHALRSDGEVVRMRWPGHFTGPA